MGEINIMSNKFVIEKIKSSIHINTTSISEYNAKIIYLQDSIVGVQKRIEELVNFNLDYEAAIVVLANDNNIKHGD